MLQSRLPYECACVSCELAPKVNSNTYDMTLLPRRCAQTDAASNEFLHLTLTVPITLSALFCGMVITMITCSFSPETQRIKLKYVFFSKNTISLDTRAMRCMIGGRANSLCIEPAQLQRRSHGLKERPLGRRAQALMA